MAQPRQRRRRRLLAGILLLLLSLCCLARLAGAASSAAPAASSTGRGRKDGAATAAEKAAGLQEAARGFTATTAVPVRVEMEVDVEDYAGSGANDRHEPRDPGYPGYSRGRQHP